MYKKEDTNNNFYTPVYEFLKTSTNLTDLRKKLSISKQDLNYYLHKLKANLLIKHISKGHWEVIDSSKNIPKDTSKKEIRGHAFIWKIKIPKEIKNWKNRIEILKKNNINFLLVGINKSIPRILINNKKVWLGNKNIIIYDTNSYYATKPIEVRKYAIYELSLILGMLESKLGINIKPYTFKPKREHYSLIKNELAIQCNKNNEKIQVFDNGQNWMCIDNSYNLNECEFFTTKDISGLVNSTGSQGFFNSQKNTNWKVTPDFVLNVMNGIQQNQLIFAKNMESHISAIKTLGQEVKGLSKVIRTIKSENAKLRLGSQKTLWDYK